MLPNIDERLSLLYQRSTGTFLRPTNLTLPLHKVNSKAVDPQTINAKEKYALRFLIGSKVKYLSYTEHTHFQCVYKALFLCRLILCVAAASFAYIHIAAIL